MRNTIWVAAVVAILGIGGSASADITYSIETAGTFSGATGSTVNVQIYLVETIDSSKPPNTGQESMGMIRSGLPVANQYGIATNTFGVNRYAGDATITAIGSAAFIDPAPAGPPSPQLVAQIQPGGVRAAWNDQRANDGTVANGGVLVGTNVSATVSKVLIGTMAIQVGSVVSSYNIGDAFPGSSAANNLAVPQWLTAPGDGDDLAFGAASQSGIQYTGAFDNGYDPITNPNVYTFDITPTTAGVPEPSSMALCGIAIGGMGLGAWRRRKAKLAAAAEAAKTAEAPVAV